MDFSQTCVSTSPKYALLVIATIFSLKLTLEYTYLRKGITLQADTYDLHKLSDTQSILMYHSVASES